MPPPHDAQVENTNTFPVNVVFVGLQTLLRKRPDQNRAPSSPLETNHQNQPP